MDLPFIVLQLTLITMNVTPRLSLSLNHAAVQYG